MTWEGSNHFCPKAPYDQKFINLDSITENTQNTQESTGIEWEIEKKKDGIVYRADYVRFGKNLLGKRVRAKQYEALITHVKQWK